MVRINPDLPDNFYPSRDWPRTARSFEGVPQDENRFSAASSSAVHSREQTVECALRECARIPVKDFALVVLTDSGEEKIYLSRSLIQFQPRIFTDRFREEFRRCSHRAAGGQFPESDRPHSRRQRSDSEDESSSNTQSSRKRARYPYRERSSNDDSNPLQAQKTQQLTIGDSAEVEKFYTVRFKDMQQSACKVMGKAFVKLVEPKKQTHHPYTKGNDQAPPWWPNTEGENRVRHREPDHLLKPERIQLLVHILKMVIEPVERQHPTVLKLGLNVKKLEDVTMEQMSTWFNDKDHPGNKKKQPFLKEIFKIAKAQERYKRGEMDPTTVIPVMYGERAGLDNSDDDDEENLREEEDAPSNSGLATPDSLVSPPIGPPHHMQRSEPDPMALQNLRNMPMRHNSQPQPQMDDHYDSTFSYPRTLGFQPPQSPTIIDRRSQYVSPQPIYQNPQSNMFHWQSPIVTNPGMAGTYYTTSPQNSLPPANQYQLPPPTALPMLPPPSSHFDPLPPSRSYETNSPLNNQGRSNSLSHPHSLSQNYENYLHDSGSFQQDSDLKDDHLHQS